jgi:hypothetical protein
MSSVRLNLPGYSPVTRIRELTPYQHYILWSTNLPTTKYRTPIATETKICSADHAEQDGRRGGARSQGLSGQRSEGVAVGCRACRVRNPTARLPNSPPKKIRAGGAPRGPVHRLPDCWKSSYSDRFHRSSWTCSEGRDPDEYSCSPRPNSPGQPPRTFQK